MKIRTMLLAGVFTLGSLAAGSSLALTSGAQKKDQVISKTPKQPLTIALQCKNNGGQQDVAKNPDIINSTTKTIPSGKTLYWKASDGDKGSVVLDHALAPGGKVRVMGTPGQTYNCSAWMPSF